MASRLLVFVTENMSPANAPLPGAGGHGGSPQNDRGIMRDFTPRSFDPKKLELTLEFALHGEGAATAWPAQFAPGTAAIH
jgi:NADPH-dependent ferric siderophore reductase